MVRIFAPRGQTLFGVQYLVTKPKKHVRASAIFFKLISFGQLKRERIGYDLSDGRKEIRNGLKIGRCVEATRIKFIFRAKCFRVECARRENSIR